MVTPTKMISREPIQYDQDFKLAVKLNPSPSTAFFTSKSWIQRALKSRWLLPSFVE
jgi:hypothetical protein